MSCSSYSDTTSLNRCTPVEDSTLLGHCNEDHTNTPTVLAHLTRDTAVAMCVQHCTKSMGKTAAETACAADNNITFKNGSYHWNIPGKCRLQCT